MRRYGVLSAALFCVLVLTACGNNTGEEAVLGDPVGSMEVQYAEQFAVDYYAGGAALLTVADADKYLVLPAEREVPGGLPEDITVLRQPAEHIYLASSSAADLFLQIDALSAVDMTSTTAANWRLPEMVNALEEGKILYAGKYSAPDYELILSEGCDLAVENTMIFHCPEIKEKLEDLGLPVLVEYSSYEPHPLGRVEWIKVYGLLTGRTEEAERFFAEQTESLGDLGSVSPSGKTVVFFHINTSGAAVVRKPGDYVSKMIELAGGAYVFSELEEHDDSALSTMNMQMEAFYAQAKDADILIYNSTVDSEIYSMEELLEKSSLLADFKAVQDGNVWCTEQNMFQQTSAAAGMIADIRAILSGKGDTELTFLHKLT